MMSALRTKNTGLNEKLKEARREHYGALILCGGKGTRMAELTGGSIPKPLYRIAGRELIRYSLDILDEKIVDVVLFAAKHLSEQMNAWIGSAQMPYEKIFMKVNGNSTAAAMSEGLARMDRDRIIICSGDEIIRNFKLEDMVSHHELTGSILTILATDPKNAAGNGVLLNVEGSRVISMMESKSAKRSERNGFLYHAGIIIINKEALRHIDFQDGSQVGGVIEMPVMQGGIESGILNAYIDRDVVFFNINSPEEVKKATKHLLRK